MTRNNDESGKTFRSGAQLKANMYSGFQLCPDLKLKEKCFRLRRYNEGVFDDLFHEHVPRHRISLDDAIDMMKALVVRYNAYEAPYILRSYLNNRGYNPEAVKTLQIVVEYPERGVMRRYCSSSHVQAWMDEIIVPQQFRKTGDG